MSHIVEGATTITNPNRALLAQAAQFVANQHQGQIKEQYVDYWGTAHSVSTGIAIFTTVLHRGIGVEVKESGELTFIGDPWAVQSEFEQMQREVVQAYVALATMQALQALGYSSQAVDGENRAVVIQGVQYA